MKAIILIELDEEHLIKQTNDLYDRLKGYKCELRPLPEKNTWDVTPNGYATEFAEGWNACLEEITGETV